MVGAVGEMAYMKRRKLGRMGCVAPAGPSKLGWVPRHCQKNGVKSHCFVVSSVLPATPQTGRNGQGI